MCFFSLSTSTSGTVQWAWGAGVKQDPPKCPQFHSHPCSDARSGFLSCNLHQLWEGEGERWDAARELSLHPKHSSQPLQRVSSDILVCLGGSGRRSPGTLLQWVLPRALQLPPCSQTQSQATAWQNEDSMQAVREPRVVCRMTQTFPHPAVPRPKRQAGTCASSCLVATCPQALLSRMMATKCPQLPSLCPTQLWHMGNNNLCP